MNTPSSSLLPQLIVNAPVNGLLVIGGIVAIFYLGKARSAALWVILGLFVLFCASLLALGIPLIVSSSVLSLGGDSSARQSAGIVIGFLVSCIRAAGYICLLVAAFCGRNIPSTVPPRVS